MNYLLFIPCLLVACLAACTPLAEDQTRYPEAITVPPQIDGRPTQVSGTLVVRSRTIVVRAWDASADDGDTISLYLGARKIINQDRVRLLDVSRLDTVQIAECGYTYLALFAHNLGSSPPNTAAVSVRGLGETREFRINLSADLTYVDVQQLIYQP
jgi:hypothetical protein